MGIQCSFRKHASAWHRWGGLPEGLSGLDEFSEGLPPNNWAPPPAFLTLKNIQIVSPLFDWKKLLDGLYECRPTRVRESESQTKDVLKTAWDIAEWDEAAADRVIEALGLKSRKSEGQWQWAMAVQNLERVAIAINLFYTVSF